MQRIFSMVRSLSNLSVNISKTNVSLLQNVLGSLQSGYGSKLLVPQGTMIIPVCNFKVKGHLRRRCKSCYFVMRDERLYVICPKFPRHKQMAMKAKPLNTWVLTHASQSPVRPW